MEDLIDTPFDYMEVVLCPPKDETQNAAIRSYDIDDEQFNGCLKKMKAFQYANQYKCFTVDTKEYYHRNLHLIKKIKDNVVEETKVYQVSPIDYIDCPGNRVITYDKKKLSTVVFPSTQKYDMIKYKRKLIFRINNKIYVNFQQEKDGEKLSKKIYINFNNNKDTNIKDSFITIKKLINDIL